MDAHPLCDSMWAYLPKKLLRNCQGLKRLGSVRRWRRMPSSAFRRELRESRDRRWPRDEDDRWLRMDYPDWEDQ